MFVLVIFWVAGRKLSVPIDRQANFFELCAHCGDVFVGPFTRVNIVFHGRIFSGHAKGVPTHRVQYIVPCSAFETRDNVAHGVVTDVPHVNAT